MKDVISKEHVFSHPIDRVWNAISIGEEISVWFVKADFKPEPGYRYTFTASGKEDCTLITGVVKMAQPYTLIYTWVEGDSQTETLVTWKLEELGGKTKLYLEHKGVMAYPDANAITMFERFDQGWTGCIAQLTTYLKQAIHAG